METNYIRSDSGIFSLPLDVLKIIAKYSVGDNPHYFDQFSTVCTVFRHVVYNNTFIHEQFFNPLCQQFENTVLNGTLEFIQEDAEKTPLERLKRVLGPLRKASIAMNKILPKPKVLATSYNVMKLVDSFDKKIDVKNYPKFLEDFQNAVKTNNFVLVLMFLDIKNSSLTFFNNEVAVGVAKIEHDFYEQIVVAAENENLEILQAINSGTQPKAFKKGQLIKKAVDEALAKRDLAVLDFLFHLDFPRKDFSDQIMRTLTLARESKHESLISAILGSDQSVRNCAFGIVENHTKSSSWDVWQSKMDAAAAIMEQDFALFTKDKSGEQ